MTPEVARARRVLLMLVPICALSLGDLYMTFLYLTHAGLMEVNPAARIVINTQSPALFIAWKLGTLFVAMALLAKVRHARLAEVAAICACLFLTALTIHWSRYASSAHELTPALAFMESFDPHNWVHMIPAPAGRTIATHPMP